MTAPSIRLTDEQRADIQGFVTSGYGHLRAAAYAFVRLHDVSGAREWIRTLEPAIATSRPWPAAADGRKDRPASAVNLAFTAQGLEACGLPRRVVCTFPPEFQEGIDAPHRSRILGDTDDSAPDRWEIGGPERNVHALVLVHAENETVLERICREQRARVEQTGGAVTELPEGWQRGYRPEHDREHFGFHDGISQPSIAGLAERGVPTGEFILGYENHYGVVPPTPVVPGDLDPAGVLPALDNPYHAATLRDFGRHGSFVVYRKLRQHVGAFWTFMRQEAARAGRSGDAAYMIWLASKCVGRWPSGAPLVMAPDRDDRALASGDDFLYASDPDGIACPLGAHVRRTNPRDVIKPYEAEQSLHMSEAHRVIRRGRAFGSPLFDLTSLDEASGDRIRRTLLELQDDGQPRGVHFFCVNASIRSQFEFVQQTWCNNPRFAGLRGNKDPLVGDHGGSGQAATCMTIPLPSGSQQTAAMPRFVTVSGGAYLFMPGLTALRFLGRSA